MYGHYFNFSTHIADSRWDRRSFLRRWRTIYADDRRWTPSAHRELTRVLQPGRYEHLDRTSPLLLRIDALHRSGQRMTAAGGSGAYGMSGSVFENTVAAVVVMQDPRRQDRAAYLGLLHFVNDDEVLDRMLGILMEELWRTGCRRIIGPTDLSPRLASGALNDHFDVTPPLGTPYNPPYVPELLHQALQPLERSRLFQAVFGDEAMAAPSGPAELSLLSPERLGNELLFLLGCAYDAEDGTPPPDQPEAVFLLDWVRTWPTEFWLATVQGRPVGFVALQPDLASAVRRARGGRNPLWRAWLAWRMQRPAPKGRVLFGAVDGRWRGQGIGRQLWQHACWHAHRRGWRSLVVGPIPDGSNAATFLSHMGATPRQGYVTYCLDL